MTKRTRPLSTRGRIPIAITADFDGNATIARTDQRGAVIAAVHITAADLPHVLTVLRAIAERAPASP